MSKSNVRVWRRYKFYELIFHTRDQATDIIATGSRINYEVHSGARNVQFWQYLFLRYDKTWAGKKIL